MALASVSRFVIGLFVGPRTLASAQRLVASVAAVGNGGGLAPPLFLVDDHRPYPQAILTVYGRLRHRRRPSGRGRKRHPDLQPRPGLLVGVVQKVRDAAGKLVRVQVKALFGGLRAIRAKVAALGLGAEVNTAHLERLNGTARVQQARLTRRTQSRSRDERWLTWSLQLWRDVYNWVRGHGSLGGRTPAQAQGLADHAWSVREYVRYPVHVSDLQREGWAEQQREALTSALDRYKAKKPLPTS